MKDEGCEECEGVAGGGWKAVRKVWGEQGLREARDVLHAARRGGDLYPRRRMVGGGGDNMQRFHHRCLNPARGRQGSGTFFGSL